MTKEEVLDYVMQTPHNTNRSVLNSMLNQLVEEDGGTGMSPLVVNCSLSEDSEFIDGSMDTDIPTQISALESGREVIWKIAMGDAYFSVIPSEWLYNGNNYVIKGTCLNPTNNELTAIIAYAPPYDPDRAMFEHINYTIP